MRETLLTELVSQYVDQINSATGDTVAYLSAFPSYRPDLEPLFMVASRLKSLLVPMEPSPEFRDSLGVQLMAAWHRQKQQAEGKDQQQRRELLIRAAAVGSFVSVAALVAVVARSRWIGNRVA